MLLRSTVPVPGIGSGFGWRLTTTQLVALRCATAMQGESLCLTPGGIPPARPGRIVVPIRGNGPREATNPVIVRAHPTGKVPEARCLCGEDYSELRFRIAGPVSGIGDHPTRTSRRAANKTSHNSPAGFSCFGRDSLACLNQACPVFLVVAHDFSDIETLVAFHPRTIAHRFALVLIN